ncbi:MAG: hypothetical protein IT300_09305 [Dehalococcoidia bacterium]|nr:hypothetical protein [Dehalococcoidia bacterium]
MTTRVAYQAIRRRRRRVTIALIPVGALVIALLVFGSIVPYRTVRGYSCANTGSFRLESQWLWGEPTTMAQASGPIEKRLVAASRPVVHRWVFESGSEFRLFSQRNLHGTPIRLVFDRRFQKSLAALPDEEFFPLTEWLKTATFDEVEALSKKDFEASLQAPTPRDALPSGDSSAGAT